MKAYKVVAQFADKVPNVAGKIPYTKTFGPFLSRSQAEATIVQLADQASCQGAEVVETESPE